MEKSNTTDVCFYLTYRRLGLVVIIDSIISADKDQNKVLCYAKGRGIIAVPLSEKEKKTQENKPFPKPRFRHVQQK